MFGWFGGWLFGWSVCCLVGSRYSPGTALLLKLRLKGCPETSAPNYFSTLRETPKERRSHWHRGGRLRSRINSEKRDMFEDIEFLLCCSYLCI